MSTVVTPSVNRFPGEAWGGQQAPAGKGLRNLRSRYLTVTAEGGRKMYAIRRFFGLRGSNGMYRYPSSHELVVFQDMREFFAWKLFNDSNVIIVIDGQQGSGKSSAMMSVASILDRNINLKTQLVFNAGGFVNVMKNVLATPTSAEKFDSKPILFDEAGVGTRVKQSGAVQELKNMLDFCRQWHIHFIFTVPNCQDISMILQHAHVFINCSKSDADAEDVHATWDIGFRFRFDHERCNPSCVGLNSSHRPVFLCNACRFKGPRPVRSSYDFRPHCWGYSVARDIRVKWLPNDVWLPYQEYKHLFGSIMTFKGLERVEMLAGREDGLLANMSLDQMQQYWDVLREQWSQKDEEGEVEESTDEIISSGMSDRQMFVKFIHEYYDKICSVESHLNPTDVSEKLKQHGYPLIAGPGKVTSLLQKLNYTRKQKVGNRTFYYISKKRTKELYAKMLRPEQQKVVFGHGETEEDLKDAYLQRHGELFK